MYQMYVELIGFNYAIEYNTRYMYSFFWTKNKIWRVWTIIPFVQSVEQKESFPWA